MRATSFQPFRFRGICLLLAISAVLICWCRNVDDFGERRFFLEEIHWFGLLPTSQVARRLRNGSRLCFVRSALNLQGGDVLIRQRFRCSYIITKIMQIVKGGVVTTIKIHSSELSERSKCNGPIKDVEEIEV